MIRAALPSLSFCLSVCLSFFLSFSFPFFFVCGIFAFFYILLFFFALLIAVSGDNPSTTLE